MDEVYQSLINELPPVESGFYFKDYDYNLNSPLMPTIFKMLHQQNTYNIPREFRQKIIDIKYLLTTLDFDISKLESLHEFHKVFGYINLYKFKPSDFAKSILSDIMHNSNLTSWVPLTFLKTLYKTIKPLKDYDVSVIKPITLKYLEYFLYTHISTLLLNASESEKTKICESFPEIQAYTYKSIHSTTEVFQIILPKPFGRTFLYRGFILLLDHYLLIDRDCLLMMKDVYLARFQSLFSYQFRSDSTYSINTLNVMSKLYQIGDQLLYNYGNPIYKVFQLIEPICNLQLCNLARLYRPLIPKLDKFHIHVTTKLEELTKLFPQCVELYKIITSLQNHNDVLAVFSSFRHWGHPFIDYETGILELFERLNKDRKVDRPYSEILASNLAFKVIRRYFYRKKTWPITPDHYPEVQDTIRGFVIEGTWPTTLAITKFGHNWHRIPIKPIFDIPEVIPPQVILSDKSHTLNRDEFLEAIRNGKPTSKRVLETFCQKPQRNFQEFLKNIARDGLEPNTRIISLCAKEKELKEKGRYFALMSWDMRDYFVSTEYLIKEHFLPYFLGITMADDQSKLIKKMLYNTMGQGRNDYEQITIANHIDYEKWCNSQTLESTEAVFTFMGQCFGLPNLFTYTHKLFETSWIFHKHRLDLIDFTDIIPKNKNCNTPSFCNGIKGGLEGLRQKGWSIISLLIIEHEMEKGPANVKVLAQGDNQVICTNFKLNKNLPNDELVWELSKIVKVNHNIINHIEQGIEKMGMTLNKDETMQSADYLVYGKIPVFRGQIFGLEPKRWSRVNTITNDQTPTLGNLLSSASSNSLVVSMYSSSPISCIFHYNFLGNFVFYLTSRYNIILNKNMIKVINKMTDNDKLKFLTFILYLDPCLGGIGGTSLTRFIMRGFPDPVSESLVFWKYLYHNTSDPVKKFICIRAGHPELSKNYYNDYSKLLEDPQSLNLKKGFDSTSYLKNQVRKALYHNKDNIKNQSLKSAIEHHIKYDSLFIQYLFTIKPVFPRFLSNFYSASWFGIVEGCIRLFERSKTLIKVFGKELNKDIALKMQTTENDIYKTIHIKVSTPMEIWDCSRIHADKLRFDSWGTLLIATTIPHPLEFLSNMTLLKPTCFICLDQDERDIIKANFVSVLVPKGIVNYETTRGMLKAYLGSKTPEDTSIIRPYDKSYNLPIIKRSLELLKAINWITDADSNLTKSILSNIKAQCNLDIQIKQKGIKLSGNYGHRFFSDRQSAGGYCNQSVNKLTHISVSSDNFRTFPFEDGNFMFQSIMLYAQHLIGEIHDQNPDPGFYHFHPSCSDCFQEIPEVKLESSSTFEFQKIFYELKKWQPSLTTIKINLFKIPTPDAKDWESLDYRDKSYYLGYNQGAIFSILALENSEKVDNSSLFPLTLQNKLEAESWYNGLLTGICHQSALECCTLSINLHTRNILAQLNSIVNGIIDKMLKNTNYLQLTSSNNMSKICKIIPHKIPPSYPLTAQDSAAQQITILRYLLRQSIDTNFIHLTKTKYYIAPDFSESYQQFLINLGVLFFFKGQKCQFNFNKLRHDIIITGRLYSRCREEDLTENEQLGLSRICPVLSKQIRVIAREEIQPHLVMTDFAPELICKEPVSYVYKYKLEYSSIDDYTFDIRHSYQFPLLSGMRWAQLATGSYWKISSIINDLQFTYKDFLCGGDGSGGIAGFLIRNSPNSRFIFNTLLEFDNINLSGMEPRQPAVLQHLGIKYSRQCVNIDTIWKGHTDLNNTKTWDQFKYLKDYYNLDLSLGIFDMELINQSDIINIINNICLYSDSLFNSKSLIIVKTYYSYLFEFRILNTLSSHFKELTLVYTTFSSLFSSEIYILCKDRKLVKKRILYPNLRKLRLSQQFQPPCNQSFESELERCITAYRFSRYVHYPEWLISDPFIEFEQILRSINVAPTLTYSFITDLQKSTQNDLLSILFGIMIAGSYSLINSLKITNVPIFPSRTQWCNIGILMICAYSILSISKTDYDLFEYLVKMYNNRYTIWITRFLLQDENNELLGHRLSWSLNEHIDSERLSLIINTEGYTITKIINQIIKICNLKEIDITKLALNQGIIELFISSYNPNLTLYKIKKSSGWLDLLIVKEQFPIIYTSSSGTTLEDWNEPETACYQDGDVL
uniref:Replicase n=1 Tax=Xiangshan rhabdo-like virus 5 TaxID=2886228 RepID=A0A8K1YQQ8_9RHAB|nr:MAG: RNA dependent RNA polymerase [Xiangshan rhabdo-like virus 5]